MFFLNLTAGEFFALFSTLGGLVTALYLLDRSRRKKVVSTLRFWPSVAAADEQTRRRRMHQPWSLILQLVSLALLLLAIAQLQWGNREGRSRDHVLLLDTSVWSGANSSEGVVLDRERQLAARYLERLPARDRVMLVRVDALASPAAPFTSSREQVLTALRESTASASALDLGQALSLAQGAQNWSGNPPGEIVYVGPKRVSADRPIGPTPANLRVLAVPVDKGNAGIRNISVKRSDEEKNSWEAAVTLKNEGSSSRRLLLKTQFAGTRFAPRVYTLRPGEEIGAKYNFVTNTAGQLIAEIDSNDSLRSDNRAQLQLPGNSSFTIAAYTYRRDNLRPLLEANRRLNVYYFDPSQYTPKPAADLMLLDGIAPKQAPAIPSLWIHPPQEGSLWPVKSVVKDAAITAWHTDLLFETGLRARQDRIGEAEVFTGSNDTIPIASIAEGPVVAAWAGSSSHPKSAVVGFDPLAGNLRFTTTTPLLFASLLHWLAPEALGNADMFEASRIGAVTIPLDAGERPNELHVIDGRGLALPFTFREQTLQLFISQPTIVHVNSGGGHRRTFSFTLPDVAEGVWTPPANVPTGLPPSASVLPTSVDVWKWLACLGGLGIFAEWWIFGRQRRPMVRRTRTASTRDEPAPKRERELAAK